jgi:hypothetical protein
MEYDQNTNGRLKRVQRKGLYEDVNVAMWKWFEAARARNIPVSGPLMQDKSLEFGLQMEYPDFKASNGWLEAFRKCHTVVFRTMSGESHDATTDDIEEFRLRLPEIISEFKQEGSSHLPLMCSLPAPQRSRLTKTCLVDAIDLARPMQMSSGLWSGNHLPLNNNNKRVDLRTAHDIL